MVLVAAVSGLGWKAAAQTISWDFGAGSASNAMPTTSSAPNVSASDVSRGNNNGTTTLLTATSPSSGYSGASGNCNAGAAARTGALNTGIDGSAYFEFVLTPDAGSALSVTNVSFGARSTGTGPQAFCVRCSLDGYASDLATGPLSADSAWAGKSVPSTFVSSASGAAVTFRIYGFSETGSASQNTANWRIDDLSVEALAVEPGATSPPVIVPLSAQAVRVGQTLTFSLTITPTDNDPVTATNVTSSAGVTGGWSLADGCFSYSPVAEDVGLRTFTFTATDKDGVSAPMAVMATVLKAQVAAVRLTAATGSYTQAFDRLATNGADNVWDNAAEPLEAWHAYAGAAAVATYRTGTGSGTSGGLYAFGASSTNTDRSLGSLAGSGTTYQYGVAFTNATGQPLTNLSIRFTAEQWRVGQSALTNTLAFDYCVTNRVLPLNQGSWRRVAALCYDSPALTNAIQSGGAIYRSAELSATIPRLIASGQVLLLRWSDLDDTGSDHAFGIDDLTVTWAAGAAPEALRVGRAGVTENFDDMGSAANAELPLFWRIESRDDAPRLSGTYASAAERTLQANAASNFTAPGSYNFSSAGLFDQGIGGLSVSNAAKSVTVFAKFSNATGIPLRRLNIRYAVEKYRNGLTGCSVRLLASTDGEAWAAVGEPTSFASDADNSGPALDVRPGMSVAAERQVVFGLPVAAGGVFYLAWQYAVTEGNLTTDAQALGVDDIYVVPQMPTECVLMVK